MIRKIRKKFIVAAIISVFLVLSILIGSILWLTNAVFVRYAAHATGS